jgi:hypothetical protein
MFSAGFSITQKPFLSKIRRLCVTAVPRELPFKRRVLIGGTAVTQYRICRTRSGDNMDFSDVVIAQIKNPLEVLCADLMKAGELDQYLFFNGVSEMIGDASDEGAVMMGCIELGRCAFLGFRFTPDIEVQVTRILDHAIDLSSIMSADYEH